MESVVSFIASSSVRSETLVSVAEGPLPTEDVLERVDASQSAVYDALDTLDRRGYLTDRDGEWKATGKGNVVADRVTEDRALDSLLADEYWETHDTSRIPREVRLRIGALADADVVRASDTEPYAVLRELRDRMADAASPDIVSPMVHPDYVESMPDADGARLVLDPSVIEETLGDPDSDVEVRTFEETRVRLLEVDVALMTTAHELTLSLPTLDGEYDHRATVVCESDAAVDWGADYFETLWTRARPAEEVLAELDVSL